MNDTPRTDAIVRSLNGSDSQPFLDFARQLERELNEANELLSEKEAALMECGYKLAGLNDQLKEQYEWRRCAEMLARALIEESDCEADETCPCVGCSSLVYFATLKAKETK